MPIYEYRCRQCGQITEAFIRRSEEASAQSCSHCGSGRLERVYLSTIAPVRTRSSGAGVPCCGELEGCSNPKRCCQQ
jgi:putative FmdB family regulatory protein